MSTVSDDGVVRGKRPLVVVIDAGHGGQDPGVTYPLVPPSDTCELVEKDVTLAIARRLRAELLEMPWPIAVEMTRDDDDDLSLRARGELAKKYGADLVISLHVNSSPDASTSGLMTFARQGDILGESVARLVARQAPLELLRKVNGYFLCDPQVDWLGRARHVVEAFAPSSCVLVETAHCTNDADREEILRASVQLGVARACAVGVRHYLGMSGVFSGERASI